MRFNGVLLQNQAASRLCKARVLMILRLPASLSRLCRVNRGACIWGHAGRPSCIFHFVFVADRIVTISFMAIILFFRQQKIPQTYIKCLRSGKQFFEFLFMAHKPQAETVETCQKINNFPLQSVGSQTSQLTGCSQ